MFKKSLKKLTQIFPTKFLISAFIGICLIGLCAAKKSTALRVQKEPIQAPHECDSLDIRNDCSSFRLLENCTVIRGYLIIALLPREKSTENCLQECIWKNIKFPELREVTDYIIFFHVKGLTNILGMFPNLTVIRGRRLFLNYALGISEMPDLERIEFQSLVAIQRGHVFIGSSPKLCQLERINWDRLTLTTGENHIIPVAPETCEIKPICRGCEPAYCWSNFRCQKFENDNIFTTMTNTLHCDEQCLGGCNKTPTDCAACRGLTDQGKCVKECPTDKLTHEHSQRCYTYDECINEMGLFRHKDFCVSQCPSGLRPNSNGTCDACASNQQCLNYCNAESEEFITIYNLADADHLAGCEIVNATLMIIVRNKINETDLMSRLSSIREIRGYLKVFRSTQLSSLKFLSNLEKIGGHPTESGHYSLIIYGNKNLKELWKPKPNFQLERGGMYIHANNKLCNHYLMEFRDAVHHDHDKDHIQESDQEVLCGPAKLLLDIQVLSHRELLFSWPKDHTYEKIEVMYRPVEKSEVFSDETELDTPICERVNWRRELILHDEIRENGTHYSYVVDDLKQNTKYACLVKTFGTSYAHTARSDLVFMTTKINIPPPPKIEILDKTNSTLVIRLNANNKDISDCMIDHYLLELYEKPDSVQYLDKRNFCENPAHRSKELLTEAYSNSIYNEDYDDCCARLENTLEDERFMSSIESEFSCSLDHRDRCVSKSKIEGAEEPLRDIRLQSNESQHELASLKPFRLYVIMLKACNVIGCSSFSMRSERTDYSKDADLVGNLDGCRVPNSDNYQINFNEPKNPNGAIVSYVVHMRHYVEGAKHYRTHIGCVTRLQHANENYSFMRQVNYTCNQVAVRAHSLAGATITDWVAITPCDGTSLAASTKRSGHGNDKKQHLSPTHGHRRGINIFLIFFLIGCAGTALWVCYKRRYWRRLPELRNFLSLNRAQLPQILINRTDSPVDEDRQILVDNFETVRFHNIRPFDDDDNDTTVSSMSE